MVFVTRRLFATYVVRRPCASSVTIYSACMLRFVSLYYKISCKQKSVTQSFQKLVARLRLPL